MDRLLDLGVDGIMTDKPAVLKDVLTASRRVALTATADHGHGHRAGEHQEPRPTR